MQPRVLQFVVFFGVASAVVGAGHYYLWSRLVRGAALSPGWHRAGTILFVAMAVLAPALVVASRFAARPLQTVLASVAYVWIGLFFILFFLALAGDLVRAIVLLASKAKGEPLSPERRTLLGRAIAAGVSLAGLALGGAGLAAALGEVGVRRLRVALGRLPEGARGFRIVQLTDVHIGPTIGREWLEGIVARVNALEPDVVAITGDLVDGSVEELAEHVAPLAKLVARHGVFFVTGNHEYYSGAEAWIAELTRLGVRVLRNERVSVGPEGASFDLAGVDDWKAKGVLSSHGPDLEAALAGRDEARELVLLAHQPKQVAEAARRGVGLQLSGHTHGGQIFPWNFFVRLDQPFVAGLGRLGDTQIYVSRGTGYWGPPMRVAAPAEITLIELDRA